ncbi:efflux RND transporter periplasmic adaptor subunit [Chloroflexota bacterium]
MRILKIIITTFILVGLAIPAVGCGSESEAEAIPENQVITVERGNIIIDVTAAGNLALSRMEDLAFEISGTEADPLTVEEVLVEEGDSVEEGQVLVTLDTSALEEKVASREQSVKTAELNLKTEEIDFQDAKKDDSIRSAEIALEKALDSYREITYPYSYRTIALDVPEAILNFHEAELQLEKIREGLETGWDEGDGEGELTHLLTLAQENLAEARQLLSMGQGADVFVNYGDDPVLAVGDYWTLRSAQFSVEQAEMSLENAKDSFQSGLVKAEVALEKVKQSLEEARDDLEEAQDDLKKATIIAPFTGFVTQVNVEGGDEARKGTVAVQIADPNKFEAEVMVSEMDILQVKLEGAAWVQVDAMAGLTLPAKVAHISPTATIQSGVVNYTVKVEIASLEAVMQERQAARQEAIQKIEQGELPERLKQAIEEGRITREQAEEMIKQRQQEQGGQQGQGQTAMPEDFQLREGLTVTVTIVVEEKNDVLLVPNGAITRKGNEAYVQVVTPDGGTEERLIKTGISNWTHTEVTDGLSEGEKVIVPKGTTTTPTTPQQPSSGGMMRGMGRMLR